MRYAQLKFCVVALAACLFILLLLLFNELNKKNETNIQPVPDTLFLCGNSEAFNPLGDSIFKYNCARCHTLSDKKLSGPGLNDVFLRVPNPDTLMRTFINNSSSVYAMRISYFKQLKKKYAKIHFNHTFNFSEEEWADLLRLLKE